MKIVERFLYKVCERCKECVLDVDSNTVNLFDKMTRVISVGCKNEWLCKQLKEMHEKETEKDE